jgi:hypothetical protein
MRQRQLTHVNYRLTSHLWKNGPKEKKLFLTAEERIAANKNRRNKNDIEH